MAINALAQRAVLVSLNISFWSPYAYDRQISDDVNAQHNVTGSTKGRWNKRLVGKGTSYDAVASMQAKARQKFAAMTQPWLNDGTRILAAKNYMKFKAEMDKIKLEFEQNVENFILDYPTIQDDARGSLNGMYKDEDFPSVAKLRTKFAFAFRTMPMPTSDDFRVSLTDSQIDAIKADLESEMEKVLGDAMRHTVAQVGEMIKAIAEKLKAYNGTKQGAFRNSLIENMREVAENLEGFNLSGNAQFSAIIDRIKSELCVDDAAVLRDNDQVRNDVVTSAESIMADIEALAL